MRYWKNRNTLVFIILLFVLLLPLSEAIAQEGDDAQVGIFEEYELQPGGSIEVPVEVSGVEELYAIDIEIRFNPIVMQIEDADPNTDGVQPALGTFLDAGLLLFNTVDNDEGVIRFVMSQANPSEPKSGDGVILVLFVQGLAVGESDLEVTTLELSTRSGDLISARPVSASVKVSDDAVAKESTSIPIQDPTSLIPINTGVPTEAHTTSTPAPTSNIAEEATIESDQEISDGTMTTATPESMDIHNDEVYADDEGEAQTSVAENESNGKSEFFLLKYWWIVVLVLVLALGLGLYLRLTRR